MADRLERLCRQLLVELGENPDREGLKDTPRRFASWWREFLSPKPAVLTTFESTESGQLVVVSGIRVWSVCEHHLLPFSCVISVGVFVRNHLLGLSKFARIAQGAARRLQLQERLVQQIADQVVTASGTPDVIVCGVGEHLCMQMRGAECTAKTTTVTARGRFRHRTLRAEFLGLVQGGR